MCLLSRASETGGSPHLCCCKASTGLRSFLRGPKIAIGYPHHISLSLSLSLFDALRSAASWLSYKYEEKKRRKESTYTCAVYCRGIIYLCFVRCGDVYAQLKRERGSIFKGGPFFPFFPFHFFLFCSLPSSLFLLRPLPLFLSLS